MGGAFRQVVALSPRKRRIRLFEFDMGFEIGDAEGSQPAKNLPAGLVPQLVPTLVSTIAQVPNRNDGR